MKIKLEKNKKAYNKLSEVLTKLGKKPKRVAFDKFYNFYKYKILSKLVNDLDNKRKNILREVFGKINNSKKSNTLRRLLNLRPNLRKRILRFGIILIKELLKRRINYLLLIIFMKMNF